MCSLFGVLDCNAKLSPDSRHALFRSLAIAAEARGTDATGLAYFGEKGLVIQKAPVTATKFKFSFPKTTRFLMGHTRMTTQGDQKFNRNNHPFSGKAGITRFALAHNGIIYNDTALRKERKLPKTRIETDSYVAVQLLEKYGAVSAAGLRHVAEALEGTFTLTVLTSRGLDIVRGNNPICLYYYPKLGLYIYASTEEILKRGAFCYVALKNGFERITLKTGDILHIAPDGERTRSTFNTESLWDYSSLCGYSMTRADEAYMEMILDYAKLVGVTEREVEMLLDVGYSAWEVEEMLYDPNLRRETFAEVYEYGYY